MSDALLHASPFSGSSQDLTHTAKKQLADQLSTSVNARRGNCLPGTDGFLRGGAEEEGGGEGGSCCSIGGRTSVSALCIKVVELCWRERAASIVLEWVERTTQLRIIVLIHRRDLRPVRCGRERERRRAGDGV